MSSVVERVPVDAARQREVAAELRTFMPEDAVLWQREAVQPYECDGLSAYRQLPMVVALPKDESQVRRILRRVTGCACRSSHAVRARVSRAAHCRLPTACCCRPQS